MRLLLFLLKQIFTKHFVSNWFLVKVQVKASILMDGMETNMEIWGCPFCQGYGQAFPLERQWQLTVYGWVLPNGGSTIQRASGDYGDPLGWALLNHVQ